MHFFREIAPRCGRNSSLIELLENLDPHRGIRDDELASTANPFGAGVSRRASFSMRIRHLRSDSRELVH